MQAFGALETCYTTIARERGWRPLTKQEDRFEVVVDWLGAERAIPQADCMLAHELRSARNVVVHVRFEPSIAQVERTIGDVRRLCSRFGRTARDAMASPVETARPEQPVGELVRFMVDSGISQFPVIDAGRLVGTLSDSRVIEALDKGDGFLNQTTEVRELMSDDILPSIALGATLEEAWRMLKDSKQPALLVLTQGLPTGIITKHDLLRRIEL